jgi:CxxC motif-containing protein
MDADERRIIHYLCIGCPLGCRLEVEEDAGAIVEIRGFACKRGKEYAEREHIDPRRMVNSTVRVVNGVWARLPVKTTLPVRKDQVLALCQVLRRVTVTAPVKLGDVIVSNILETGADVVATRSMPAQ